MANATWVEVFGHTFNGLSIVVMKSYNYRDPIYSSKIGIFRQGKNEKGEDAQYLSPYMPMMRKTDVDIGVMKLQIDLAATLYSLGAAANEFIVTDMAKDFNHKIEQQQQKESANMRAIKPSTVGSNGAVASGMRNVGKTQKKKDKLAARQAEGKK